MTRRSFLVTLSCALLGLSLLGIMLLGLLRFQYRWYKQAALTPSRSREQDALQFSTTLVQAEDLIKYERDWEVRFNDRQINSFLEEGGFRQSSVEMHFTLPEGISEPRVAFDQERMKVAFRYGTGLLSTVISIDLRVWLAAQDQNAVVLELEGFHAGALPIAARSLLEQVSEVGRSYGIGVYWYRDQKSGHPVAVLRFQEDQQHAKWILDGLQLTAGEIYISGRSADNNLPKTNVKAEANLEFQSLGE